MLQIFKNSEAILGKSRIVRFVGNTNKHENVTVTNISNEKVMYVNEFGNNRSLDLSKNKIELYKL